MVRKQLELPHEKTNNVVLNRSDTNGFKKRRDCTITKAQISLQVTPELSCVFVFAYANCSFSHEAAHLLSRFCLSY